LRTIAVALSKGGSAKTTTAINLAAGLAKRGSRVLLVDTDTQGQAAPSLGLEPEAGLAELLAGEIKLEQAICRAREGLWLIAGGDALGGSKRAIARMDSGAEQLLSQALAPVAGQYDYVILDSAPGWDTLTVNVLFYAEEVLAPVSLEPLTIRGLMDFERRLEAIQQYHPIRLAYVLPTFHDLRVRKSSELLQQLQAHYGERLCLPIRYNVKLSEAPAFGQTIYEYAPHSTGASDYQQLTERIARDG
jgi:chromosome partitioning protein